MAVKYNGANVNDIKYKVGTTTYNVNILKKDDTITWCRPFTYTQGTLPTGVASLVCTRNSTNQPGASTGTIASGGTIYYSDKLYWTATASTGYNSPTVTYYNASHTLSITGGVTGTSYVTAGARISGTYAQGTLPTGVASLTCYRKAWNGSSYSAFTSGTIYYGDTFYWAATASTGYNNPTLTYYDSSHAYTWTGSQGGSIAGVTVSGLQAGTRITWIANVTMGTGVAKYKYSTDGGTTWSAETTAATVTSLDYATTLTVKGTTASAGYTLSGTTATATYSSKSVTVPAATRITWSMAVTMSNYVTGWRYKIDSGSWVNKTATATITGIDYASKITIEGTSKEDTEGYTYGAYQGTGTFGSGAQSSNLSTTLSCTKTRITWSLAVTQSNYISSWTYKIGSGSAVSKSASYTITGIDYADSVVIAATNQSEAPYNYGTPTGTGTFSYGSTATTLASTRSVKSYTLTISATNASYGNYSVSRTSSPYQGAATGALATGATIYYGDVLTGSSSGKGTSYGAWNITSVTAPSVTSTGAATSGNLTVTNNDSHTATLYYNTSSAVGGTSIGSAAASASLTKTGLSFNTQYYVSARVSRSRDKYVDATDGSQYSGTDRVTGNVTASFKFKRTTTTDTGTIDSSVVSAKTAAQTTYTITFTRQRKDANGLQTLGSAVSDTSIGVASVSVAYGGSYSETFSKTNYVSQTKSGSNVTASATVTVTLEPVKYNLTKSLTNWTGDWYTSNAYSTTLTWIYHGGGTAYFRATPNARYEQTVGSTRYYNGQYYTTTASNAAGSVTLSATAITYAVSGGTAGHGTVAWTNGTYGSNSTWTITANTGYTRPSTYTGTKAINTTNFTVSDANKTAVYSGNLGDCTANKYTLTINRNYYAITGAQSKASTTTADTATSIEVTYDSAYSYTYSKTGYDSQTASGTWKTAGDGSTTLTLNPHQYTVSQAAISNASESVNYAWVYYNQSATQTVTPDVGYDYTASSTRYYNGKSYTRSSGAVTANYTFATLTMNKFTYTVSGGSSTNGTVAWTGGNQIGGSATWTITANTGYTRPTNYTGSATINSTNFTLSEANKTAVYKSSFDPCTINSYAVTISATNCKSTYLSTNSSATSGSASGTSFNYNSTVYGFATLKDNTDQYTYTAPSGWTQISGRTYRVGSTVVTTSGGSISVSATQTTNTYAVNIGATTYCKAAYLSTNASATSGSASGTKFNYGATVYLFVTLNDDTAQYSYTPAGTWTQIGTSRTYRVTSLTVGTSNTFADVSATRTTNKYTVTFATTSGKYGSWSSSSITNVPYGTTISRSGNTVTVGSLGTSTFTQPATTVQYNYASPEYSSITSVTGNTTYNGGSTRSDRTYTIRWLNGDGSVLETDNNVAYNATLTYNSSTTPSKASTAQYSYTFDSWKLGSTTVTSGTTTNPGSTSSTTLDIQSQFTSTVRTYMVSVSGSNITTTGTGIHNYGDAYTVTINATLGHYLTNYTAGSTITEDITINKTVAVPTAITYSGTVTGEVSLSTSTANYYTFSYTDNNTHTYGTLTYSNSQSETIGANTYGSTAGNAQSGSRYYTGSLVIDMTYYSRLTYKAGTTSGIDNIQYYNADDRIITGKSGETGYTLIGDQWLGTGTAYKTLTCAKTITNTDYAFNATATDSRAGDIITNGLSVTITNTKNNNKSYTSTSNFRVFAAYSTTLTATTLSINNKDTTAYTYTGEGSITLGDSSSSPSSHTANYSINQYPVTITVNDHITAIYYKANGATTWSSTSTSTSIDANYNSKVYWYATAETGYNGTGSASSPVELTVGTSNTIAPTASIKTYTVTFATTSGSYGSWSSASITNVPYGTTVSRSGNTVTVGSSTSTFTKPSTTVAYNYADPSYGTIPTTVTGATTISAGCTRSDRTYTIRWLNGDGSVLETDSNIAYNATLTYNSTTTPSKSSTAQYSYSFSGWKLGSTAITSGTSKNPGSTTTTTLDIQSQFTPTTRTYTVTFSATNGSWSTGSIADVPYGTTITRSSNTVTVTGYGTSTYTLASTTVSETAGSANYTVPSSVGGATTISASTTMTTRTYTIKWIGADGSTALETDSNVAYNATLTYNGTTPTKAQTDQYTYPFSAWKLGSTSGSTVTSGTTKNPGSTSSTTINIYATFSSTERSYTVTFTAGTYGSWSPTSISALYSASISRSGDKVTVGSSSSTYSGYTATGYTTSVSYTGASGTVGTGKTITATTTRTANTYTLAAPSDVGTVTWYSDSARTTTITSATYGSTVYYSVSGTKSYQGSLTLSSTAFSISGSTATVRTYNVSTPATGVILTGGGYYIYGATYTLKITASSSSGIYHYILSYESGGTTGDPITINNQTRYLSVSYTGTSTTDVSKSVTPARYFKFTYSDNNTHTYGTLEYSNSQSETIGGNTAGSTTGNNLSATKNYTGSLKINMTFYSRLTRKASSYQNQYYNADDRVITGFSGSTSSVSLGDKWLGPDTGYQSVTCNKTITDEDYSFTASAVDSVAGDIIMNGSTVRAMNSSTNKYYESSSNFEAYTTYTQRSIALSFPYKDTSRYTYSGEGTFNFGDDSSSPSSHTLTVTEIPKLAKPNYTIDSHHSLILTCPGGGHYPDNTRIVAYWDTGEPVARLNGNIMYISYQYYPDTYGYITLHLEKDGYRKSDSITVYVQPWTT